MDLREILEIVKSIDKRLQKIELELKTTGFHDESSKQSSEMRDDNFYNKMKEELDGRNYNQPSRSKSKVKKSSSFTEKSPRKPLVRTRRNPHTVPSDKEEERRLGSFRRECLSKAIQWNFVDLLNSVSKDFDLVLPPWVKPGETKSICHGTDRKMHLRRFLNLLREKEFNVMREWLLECRIEKGVVEKVWETYQEFSDYQLNSHSMKCLHCRLVDNVDIRYVADYFYSADIIDKYKQMKIMDSNLPVGAQKSLWDNLLMDCSTAINHRIVLGALTLALSASLDNMDGCQQYKLIHTQLTESGCLKDVLACHCSEICAKSLHPLTCLKSMSLTRVYSSPPTVRKHETQTSSSDCGPETSSSSSAHSSVDESLNVHHEDNKSTSQSEEPVVEEDGQDKRVEVVFKRNRQKRVQSRVLKAKSVSNNAGLNSKSPSSTVTNKYETTENRTFENKPNIIHAKNVYLGTGQQFLSKTNNYRGHADSSSSSSEHSNET